MGILEAAEPLLHAGRLFRLYFVEKKVDCAEQTLKSILDPIASTCSLTPLPQIQFQYRSPIESQP